jgi:hypothetical protein
MMTTLSITVIFFQCGWQGLESRPGQWDDLVAIFLNLNLNLGVLTNRDGVVSMEKGAAWRYWPKVSCVPTM